MSSGGKNQLWHLPLRFPLEPFLGLFICPVLAASKVSLAILVVRLIHQKRLEYLVFLALLLASLGDFLAMLNKCQYGADRRDRLTGSSRTLQQRVLFKDKGIDYILHKGPLNVIGRIRKLDVDARNVRNVNLLGSWFLHIT